MSSRPNTVSADSSAEDEELLAYLLERESELLAAPALARRPEGTDAPLSFAQQRLWVLDRLEGDNPAFRLSIVLGLEGRLDRVALRAALEAVVARHEVLRTRFVMVGDEPLQRIASALAVEIQDTDLAGVGAEAQGPAAAGALSELLREPFDLEQGPLIRARLVRIGPESHRLLLVLHHLVGDRWSMLILSAELALLYRAFAAGSTLPLPQLPVQYGDYALWERRRLQGARLETLLAHWRRRLAGLERFELPLDRPRPAQQTFVGAYESTVLPFAAVRKIEGVARENGATRFMALLAVLAATLARFSGSTDIAIGTVTSSRSEPELERLIGLFLNTLVLRVDCTGDPRFTELLGRTREVTLDAYAHQEVPFERIVHDLNPERAMNRTPLFEVLFVQVDQALSSAKSTQGEAAPAAGGALRVQEESLALDEHKAANDESVQYDLEVYARETSAGLRISFVYNLSLFEARTVRRMLAAFEEILARAVQSPRQRLSQLTAVAGEERRQLLEHWNATQAEYARDQGLHERFEAQARRAPERIAVIDRHAQLRYDELDAMANRLAQVLVARGVGRGQRVGLCVERGVGMVAAVLGILKSGAAYVPLDPGFPAERLRFMAQDADLSLLVASTQPAALFDLPRERQLLLDADAAMLASAPSARLVGAGARGEDPAYVIYTSGSTGTPKGVVVPHRAVVNFLTSMAREPGLRADDVLVAVTTASFDIAVLELQLPLAVGARVVLATRAESSDGRALAALLNGHRANVMQATPATWRLLLAAGWRAGEGFKALVGGEALPADLAAELLAQGVELWNMYGPTETTVWSTCARVTDAGAITIGRPIANTIVRVLDGHDGLCPIGVAGELCIGGEGLSLGYWRRPELAAQKFVADPHAGAPGAKLYRTGDRARWREDGSLEHLGRLDEQVKLRGYRIEPGEIEAALRQDEAIREAAVVAREDAPGDARLVAYLVVRADAGAELDERLRAGLRARLPEYMVPAHFVRLAALPRTPNGKLDRRALPAPERSGTDERRYVAPRTPSEEILAGIWAEVLGLDRVGVEDNFFQLGGHSLLALKVIERMRQAGMRAEARSLFTTPTIATLAAMDGESAEVEVPPNRIPPGSEAITPQMLPLVQLTHEDIERIVAAVPGGAANVQDIYPLAPLQEGILFHHLMADEGDPYLLYAVLGFDTRARLDRYLQALDAVIARHDVLRTAVLWEGLSEPVQVVWRRAPLRVEEVSFATAGDVAQQLAARYDPRRYRLDVRQAPLLHLYIAHDEANGRWVMLELFHHLAMDHTAAEVLQQEVQAHLLGQVERLPVPLPFRNFVTQARLGVSRAEHEAFFKEMLGDVEEPTAPFGLVDVSGDGSVVEARQALDAQLGARLRTRARALGVSVASVCHLAWALVLARLSGREDVVFGTVLFGRMRSGEGADRVPGVFINTLPLRIRVGDDAVQDGVRRTQQLLARLLRHEHASLALAQRCSGVTPPAPLFTALLNYRHSNAAAPVSDEAVRAWEGIQFLGWQERTNFPLMLSVDDWGEALGLSVQALVPIEPQRVCAYMHRALEALVEVLERAPDAPLHGIDVLPEAERRQLLVEWNDTQADYAQDATLHALFEAQAERTPEAVAVVCGEVSLSYAALNASANRLAHRLRALGVGRGSVVALCVERSVQTAVAMLGVLKAGGAYVALEAGDPAERMSFMLEDASVDVLVTQTRMIDRLPAYRGRIVDIEAEAELLAQASGENLAPGSSADDVAYVIYTSGSTGRPKGVMGLHRGMVNRLSWLWRAYPYGADERCCQKTTLSFVDAVAELFAPLLAGVQVVIVDESTARDARDLAELAARERVTRLVVVPSLLRALLQLDGSTLQGLECVRVWVTSGERLEPALEKAFRARFPAAVLLNLYGSSEVSADVTCFDTAERGERGGSLIGRPIANTRAYVVDARMNPLPVGVPGELYVGGAGLARGYLGQAELTAERFFADPFGNEPASRLYRTGDVVRYHPDGVLEYLGRADQQLKIRGYRIEPSEVETALVRHPGVRQAVVQAEGGERLVAYFVTEADASVEVSELRKLAQEMLPAYMVPSLYMKLDAVPMTASGKVNRKALPAPERGLAQVGYVAPRTPSEQILAGVWAELLELERVGIEENFFDLGGHSLLVVAAIERMRKRTGIAISLREYMLQNLRQIAARYERALAPDASADANRSARIEPLAAETTQARPASLHGATIEPPADPEPVYFGRGGSLLFGCFHPAHEPVREGRALVICQPFGQEYVRCHRLLRVLAASLARSGVPVLRFDYHGCGDSPGENEDATLERCIADVDEAVRFVRARTRVANVDLCGLRLGASIALRYAAAARAGQVGRLVLWAPVVRGEDFLASMREQSARFSKWMKGVFRRAAAPAESDGSHDFIGFRFSETLSGELAALDLLQVAHTACRHALVLDHGKDARSAALHRRLGEIGVQAKLVQTAAPKVWLAEPYQGLVPRDSLDLVSRWLLEHRQ